MALALSLLLCILMVAAAVCNPNPRVSIRRSVLPKTESTLLSLLPDPFGQQLLLSSGRSTITTVLLVESPIVLQSSDCEYLDDDHFVSRLADSGYAVHVLTVKIRGRRRSSFYDTYKAAIGECLDTVRSCNNSNNNSNSTITATNTAVIACDLSTSYLLNLLSGGDIDCGVAVLMNVCPLHPLASSSETEIERLLHRFAEPIACNDGSTKVRETLVVDTGTAKVKSMPAIASITSTSPLWKLLQIERYSERVKAASPALYQLLSRVGADIDPVANRSLTADVPSPAANIDGELEVLIRFMRETNFNKYDDYALSATAMKKRARQSNRVYGKYDHYSNEAEDAESKLTARSVLGPPPNGLLAIKRSMQDRVLVISTMDDCTTLPSTHSDGIVLNSAGDDWGYSASREAATLTGALFLSVASREGAGEAINGVNEFLGEGSENSSGAIWGADDRARHLRIDTALRSWFRLF